MAHEFVSHLFFQQEALPRAKQKVATARYLPVGGIDGIVVAAGPDDIDVVKMDVQASEEVPSKVLKGADALFFVFGEMLYLDAGLSRLQRWTPIFGQVCGVPGVLSASCVRISAG